ncbi:hypothetical protein EVG20_g9583 [Dentipellis fragilis]|uniref:Uncharacterized protein n=1 Tax=Dentipellis fragilis TaxID=205917 RepID=A0A4Y9Y1K5_9AGAM|nr:hypothetical protein EVG20_g9583 [Dentipellis fragilis]
MTDVLPQSNEEYGTKEYWDKRYAQEAADANFDWFKKYEDVADLIREVVPDKAARILMLGCGNSTLSEDMYDDGYKNIVNIDARSSFSDIFINLTLPQYSPVVVEQMRNRHQNNRPEMSWHEMDIRALTFRDSTFDVAIDKGTMDAMMTAKGDVWGSGGIQFTDGMPQDPPQQVIDDCTKEVDEVLRWVMVAASVLLREHYPYGCARVCSVLRKGTGIFLYLTFGQPHFRRRFLTRDGTSLEIKRIGEAFHYYFYIIRT